MKITDNQKNGFIVFVDDEFVFNAEPKKRDAELSVLTEGQSIIVQMRAQSIDKVTHYITLERWDKCRIQVYETYDDKANMLKLDIQI